MASRIVGTGRAVPATALSNKDLEGRLDTSDEWIKSRTGIGKRYVLRSGESLVEVAAQASRQALDRAGLKPGNLDAIVVGTVSSDYAFPSFGCQLQHALGIDTIPAFDVAAACSGFIFALSVADSGMIAGNWNRVLVLGADALSTMVDWSDRQQAAPARRVRQGQAALDDVHDAVRGGQARALYRAGMRPGRGGGQPVFQQAQREGGHERQVLN